MTSEQIAYYSGAVIWIVMASWMYYKAWQYHKSMKAARQALDKAIEARRLCEEARQEFNAGTERAEIEVRALREEVAHKLGFDPDEHWKS